jgi:hypothetical protein
MRGWIGGSSFPKRGLPLLTAKYAFRNGAPSVRCWDRVKGLRCGPSAHLTRLRRTEWWCIRLWSPGARGAPYVANTNFVSISTLAKNALKQARRRQDFVWPKRGSGDCCLPPWLTSRHGLTGWFVASLVRCAVPRVGEWPAGRRHGDPGT